MADGVGPRFNTASQVDRGAIAPAGASPRLIGMSRQRTLCTLVCVALLTGACSARGSRATNAPHLTRPAQSTSPSTASPLSSPSTTPQSAPTVPGAPDGQTFEIPSSIRHDCSSDVAAAIQAWIDSVPDNSVLSLSPHACYRVDETLYLKDRHRLLVEGNGAAFKAVTMGTRKRQELVLSGGSGLIVRDLVVRGANPSAGAVPGAHHADLEAQHGFQVSGATDVLLDHVQAFDLYGDFVYVGPANKQPSRNVTIRNSTFARSGRQGISVTDAVGVTVQDNTISGVARSMFDIEPNVVSAQVRGIKIVGNTTGAAVNFWLADKGAPASIGDIEISDNRMVSATGGLIFVFARALPYRGPFVIAHNRFIAGNRVHDEGSKGAFFFTRAEDVSITANVVTFPKGAAMPAVELRDSHHVNVANNTFTNAGVTMSASQGSSDYHVS